MSRQLVESIIDKEFVLAESHLNDRLNAIMEKKLYEKKRMIAAKMDEALGGLTRAEIEAKKKAGFKKASDVLHDPRDIKIPMKRKDEKKKKLREAINVEPDPEARVRGGQNKSSDSSASTTTSKVARGIGRGIGKAISTVGRATHNVKRTYRLLRLKKHQQQTASQQTSGDSDLRKTFGVKEPGEKPISSREKFVNALKGREIDYRKEKETDPNKKPGVAGFLGKVARGALKGAESGLNSMEE